MATPYNAQEGHMLSRVGLLALNGFTIPEVQAILNEEEDEAMTDTCSDCGQPLDFDHIYCDPEADNYAP